MSTKHLCLSIDFAVTIADEPPPTDELNAFDPIYHGRQARLLEAVKNHPQVLTRWMHSLITTQMVQHTWPDWDISFREILAPALETLSPEDQALFEESHQGGYFGDFIDLFQASFTITEKPVVISER